MPSSERIVYGIEIAIKRTTLLYFHKALRCNELRLRGPPGDVSA